MGGRSALVSLAVGLASALVAALVLVPPRAWTAAVVPVLITAVLGGVAMIVVARRRPAAGEQPDHDPFGLLGDVTARTTEQAPDAGHDRAVIDQDGNDESGGSGSHT